MRRQVSHLKRLVDDLLDVSRIASGKLQVELRPLDLAELARQTVAALPGQPLVLEAPAGSGSTATTTAWPRCSATCCRTPPASAAARPASCCAERDAGRRY
jgi:signal transduction histidine kinase